MEKTMRFYKIILRCVFYQLVVVNLSGITFASTKIGTNLPGIFAYENTKRLHKITEEGTSVIHEELMSFDGDFAQWAPVTIYNSWPENIKNKSIFPYLARHSSINPTKYAEFCDFVSDWYQSSCAIVHCFSSDYEIIGSGSLVSENKVSTARHNFSGVPINHIFVRFFKYSVFLHKGQMLAQEESIDVPVVGTICAINGLDAGCLEIPFLDPKTFKKYARVLPIQKNVFGGSFAPGEYGMFHFAGGMHQISVGNMQECVRGSWIHDDISIQAGPGASGATVIGKWFNKTAGCGTSIYRQIGNEWEASVERRLISFSHFWKAGATIDRISAPYYYDPDFCPSVASFTESGYEYLKWRLEYAGHGNDPSSFALKVFKVDKNHSNHHIIPRGDLFYLWNYVHDVPNFEPVKDRLKAAINSQVTKEKSTMAKSRRKPFNSKERYDFLESEHLDKYKRLVAHLEALCVTSDDYHGKSQRLAGPSGFYSATWNLFKGWDSLHRSDDPVRDGEDRSEKNRPQGFNKKLWNHLKKPETGLYHRIQALKQATLRGVPDIGLLVNLDQKLDEILQLLKKNRIRLPHPYSSKEWEPEVDLYRVKKQSN